MNTRRLIISNSFHAKGLALALAALVVIGSGCARFTPVSATLTVPPRDAEALGHVHRMALIDFGSQDAPRIADAITNKLLQRMLKARGFELVEREKVKRLVDEQHFGATDYVNPATAVRLGNILGVDHLLMGTVLSFGVQDEYGSFTDVETVSGGQSVVYVQGRPVPVAQMRQQAVQRGYTTRSGSVSLNFRVVDTETGAIRMADAITRTYTSQRATEGRALPQRDQIVEDLLEQCVSEILTHFDYHTKRVECLLSTRKGMGRGNKYFANGLIQEAQEFYEAKAAGSPGNPDVNYNLGVVAETIGDLRAAEAYYKKAFAADDNEVFQSRLKIVRSRLTREGGS